MEKVRSQEAELRTLRPQGKTALTPGAELQREKAEAFDADKKTLDPKLGETGPEWAPIAQDE